MSSSVVTLALLALSGCGATLPPFEYSKLPDPRKQEFVLGINDSLKINVWKHGDLTTTATIRPDGTITMPLVGDLPAAGLKPSQLRKAIIAKLSLYIKTEALRLTIAVTAVNSYWFMVTGKAAKPGLFTSKRYVRLDEALTMAGGLTRFADPGAAACIRVGAAGKPIRIPFNAQSVLEGRSPGANFFIMAGDRIYIP